MSKKAFHYRQPASPPFTAVNRVAAPAAPEELTGIVQGKPASDIEERYARALDKNPRVAGFEFIVHEVTGANLPGEVQLDFLVDAGGQFVVQVDGDYAHKSAAQKANDAVQDARVSEALQGVVSAPYPVAGIVANGLIARVPGMLLETQAMADALVMEMF